MLGEAFDVSRPALLVVNVSLAFLRTVFWLSVTPTVAVLLVILNEVEVCPLFAACVCFVTRNTYATCTQHGVLRGHATL